MLRDLSVALVALWHRSRQWLHLDPLQGTLPSRHCAFCCGGWGSPNLEALHKRTSLTVSLTYGYIEYIDSIASLLPTNLGDQKCETRRWSFRLVDARCAWAPVPRWSKTLPGRRPTTRSWQDPAAWARREPPHQPSLLWYYLDGGGGSTKKRLLRMKVGRKMGVVENFIGSRGKGRVPDWRKTMIWVSCPTPFSDSVTCEGVYIHGWM